MTNASAPDKSLYRRACVGVINDFLELLEIPEERVELTDLANRDAMELQKAATFFSRLYNRTRNGKKKMPLEMARDKALHMLALLQL